MRAFAILPVLAERDVCNIVNGDARTAAGAMAPLVVASLLVALVVAMVSATRMPTYEASALVLLGQKDQNGAKIQLIPLAPTHEGLRTLTRTVAGAIDSRPVAEETIRRLGLGITLDALQDDLRVRPEPGTTLFRLTYADADPARARQVANTIGQVASEKVSEAGLNKSRLTATLWQSATLPTDHVSPHPVRNGLVALAVALALSAGLLAGRRALGR
jgi:capsular polysaccharide biosynthesis protein